MGLLRLETKLQESNTTTDMIYHHTENINSARGTKRLEKCGEKQSDFGASNFILVVQKQD